MSVFDLVYLISIIFIIFSLPKISTIRLCSVDPIGVDGANGMVCSFDSLFHCLTLIRFGSFSCLSAQFSSSRVCVLIVHSIAHSIGAILGHCLYFYKSLVLNGRHNGNHDAFGCFALHSVSGFQAKRKHQSVLTMPPLMSCVSQHRTHYPRAPKWRSFKIVANYLSIIIIPDNCAVPISMLLYCSILSHSAFVWLLADTIWVTTTSNDNFQLFFLLRSLWHCTFTNFCLFVLAYCIA